MAQWRRPLFNAIVGPRLLLSRRVETSLEKRLVWMFGSPRSGSTWLLRLLVHPLVPDDEAEFGVRAAQAPAAGPPRALPVNEPYIPQHLAPDLPDQEVFNEALPAATLPALRHGSPNYFLSDRFSAAWRPQLRSLVLTRLHRQVDGAAKSFSLHAPLVIVKEPNGSLGADFMMSLLPRSRLLFLLRDGRDVVDSILDARSPGGWLAGAESFGEEERMSLVRREAGLWRARTVAVRRAYERHPAELRMLVRYEELRGEPMRVLAELERWLGIERNVEQREDALRWNDFDTVPAEAKGRGKPLRAAQPGLWRQSLSAEEQRAMHEAMGDELAACGYTA